MNDGSDDQSTIGTRLVSGGHPVLGAVMMGLGIIADSSLFVGGIWLSMRGEWRLAVLWGVLLYVVPIAIWYVAFELKLIARVHNISNVLLGIVTHSQWIYFCFIHTIESMAYISWVAAVHHGVTRHQVGLASTPNWLFAYAAAVWPIDWMGTGKSEWLVTRACARVTFFALLLIDLIRSPEWLLQVVLVTMGALTAWLSIYLFRKARQDFGE